MSNRHRSLDRAALTLARLAALERDQWACVKCNADAEDVDHIVPLAQGGEPYALGNLQSLCRACHHHKTQQEQRPLGPLATELMEWATP